MDFNNYLKNIQRKQDLYKIKILQQVNNTLNSGAWFLINDKDITWTKILLNETTDILYYNFHSYIFIKEPHTPDKDDKFKAYYYIFPQRYNSINLKEWINDNYSNKEKINYIDEEDGTYIINGYLLPVHCGWSTIIDNIKKIKVDNTQSPILYKIIEGNTSFVYKNWSTTNPINDYIELNNGLQQYCIYDIDAINKQLFITFNKAYQNDKQDLITDNQIKFFYERYNNPYYDYYSNITNKTKIISYIDIQNVYTKGSTDTVNQLNYIGCYYQGLPKHNSILNSDYHEVICDYSESEDCGNLFKIQNDNSNKIILNFISDSISEAQYDLRIY